jgi:hypothetical protein
MKPFETQAIERYQDGKRTLAYSVKPGEIVQTKKDGDIEALIPAGALFLHGPSFEYIAGPVTRDGIVDTAHQILEGNQRVITAPGITMLLAMAIVAWLDVPDDVCSQSSDLEATETPHA